MFDVLPIVRTVAITIVKDSSEQFSAFFLTDSKPKVVVLEYYSNIVFARSVGFIFIVNMID